MGTSRAAGGRLDRDARLHEQQLRFEGSGQTAVAFCRDEGVVLSTFYPRRARWRKQRERDLTGVSKPAARFIEAGVMQVVDPRRIGLAGVAGGQPCAQGQKRLCH